MIGFVPKITNLKSRKLFKVYLEKGTNSKEFFKHYTDVNTFDIQNEPLRLAIHFFYSTFLIIELHFKKKQNQTATDFN